MAKRKSRGRPIKAKSRAKSAAKSAGKRRSVKRPKRRARSAPKPRAKSARKAVARAAAAPPKSAAPPKKVPRLDRERRTLEETVPTPPSSLDMKRQGSAVRTGRAEMAESLRKHGSITPGITGGDVDADFENAYFSGDEAPGGDNPTPDQDVVDDIGKALGVEYNDNEELKSSDKLSQRDKHRWELDPASSEDYKDRD